METLASTQSAPANADNTALADTGNADAKTVEANGDGSAPSVQEADTPEKVKKDPIQERFDKLTRDKYDALREGDRKGYLLEQRDLELAELRAKLESRENTQVAPANDFPTLEQYGYDEGKFQAAVAAHFSRLAAEQGRTSAEQALQKERERLNAEQAQKSWTQKESDFKKSKPDYEDKALRLPRDGGPTITPSMAQIIKQSELGPAVAYYLGENVEKSEAIARLHPFDQAREIGRIEAKLEIVKAPPKPAVSQAPPPVAKVETIEATSERTPLDMIGSTPSAFDKWRRKYRH